MMLVRADVCRCLVAVDVMILMMVSMKLVVDVDVLIVDVSQRFLRETPMRVSKRMGSLMRICTCPVGSQWIEVVQTKHVIMRRRAALPAK